MENVGHGLKEMLDYRAQGLMLEYRGVCWIIEAVRLQGMLIIEDVK